MEGKCNSFSFWMSFNNQNLPLCMVLGGFQVGCKSNISKPTFMHAKVLVFDTLCGIEKTISQRPIELGKGKKRKRKNQPMLWAVSDVEIDVQGSLVPSSLSQSVCFLVKIGFEAFCACA